MTSKRRGWGALDAGRPLAAPPANFQTVEAATFSTGCGGTRRPEDWVTLGKRVALPRENDREGACLQLEGRLEIEIGQEKHPGLLYPLLKEFISPQWGLPEAQGFVTHPTGKAVEPEAEEQKFESL